MNEVIVVGSGLGSLSAATLLVEKGLKTCSFWSRTGSLEVALQKN